MKKCQTIFAFVVMIFALVISACSSNTAPVESVPPDVAEAPPIISSEVLDEDFHVYNEMTAANKGTVYFIGYDGIYMLDRTDTPVRIIDTDEGFVIRAIAATDDYIFYLEGATNEVRFLRADHSGENIVQLTTNVDINYTWNFSTRDNKLITYLTYDGYAEADVTTSTAITFTAIEGRPAASGLSYFTVYTVHPEGMMTIPPSALFVQFTNGTSYKVVSEIDGPYIVTNDHILYVFAGTVWLAEIDGSNPKDITSQIVVVDGTSDYRESFSFANYDSDNVYVRNASNSMIYAFNIDTLTYKSYNWDAQPFDVVDGYAYGYRYDGTSGFLVSLSLETGEIRELLKSPR